MFRITTQQKLAEKWLIYWEDVNIRVAQVPGVILSSGYCGVPGTPASCHLSSKGVGVLSILAVNMCECERVCIVPCDGHSDRLWIHHDPNKNRTITEDKRMNVNIRSVLTQT